MKEIDIDNLEMVIEPTDRYLLFERFNELVEDINLVIEKMDTEDMVEYMDGHYILATPQKKCLDPKRFPKYLDPNHWPDGILKHIWVIEETPEYMILAGHIIHRATYHGVIKEMVASVSFSLFTRLDRGILYTPGRYNDDWDLFTQSSKYWRRIKNT